MKNLKSVIENIKGGKSNKEILTICIEARKTINEKEKNELEEMITYYDDVNEEVHLQDHNFVEVV